jgi:hypothetical protein
MPAFRSFGFELQRTCSAFTSWRARKRYTQALAGWTPTASEKRRLGPLPDYVQGGAANPMGARALYLYSGGQDTLYRIHGTNHPGLLCQVPAGWIDPPPVGRGENHGGEPARIQPFSRPLPARHMHGEDIDGP